MSVFDYKKMSEGEEIEGKVTGELPQDSSVPPVAFSHQTYEVVPHGEEPGSSAPSAPGAFRPGVGAAVDSGLHYAPVSQQHSDYGSAQGYAPGAAVPVTVPISGVGSQPRVAVGMSRFGGTVHTASMESSAFARGQRRELRMKQAGAVMAAGCLLFVLLIILASVGSAALAGIVLILMVVLCAVSCCLFVAAQSNF